MSEPLRTVQVGCGGMAQRWAKLACQLDEYQIVGLVDINREAAERTAEHHGFAPDVIFDTLKKALAATKPDVVFDVTVPEAHHKVVIPALRAGCHVLGEKPMSDSMARARRMVEAAEQAGRYYAITQTQRNVPAIRDFAAFCQGGAIGRIEEVHCDFFIGAHFGGFRDRMADVLLKDMAIHHFDAARRLTGADAHRVQCISYNPPRSWFEGDASAFALFEMDHDIVYTYRGSWCAEGINTTWGCHWRVIGSEGTAEWNGSDVMAAQRLRDPQQAAFIRDLEDILVPRHETAPGAHEGYMLDFARCVREGRTPETHCTDNIRSLAMVLAAVKSARTGRRQKVEW